MPPTTLRRWQNRKSQIALPPLLRPIINAGNQLMLVPIPSSLPLIKIAVIKFVVQISRCRSPEQEHIHIEVSDKIMTITNAATATAISDVNYKSQLYGWINFCGNHHVQPLHMERKRGGCEARKLTERRRRQKRETVG